MSYEVDGEIHPPLDTFGHNRVFEVTTVEEPVVAWRLKFSKKGLPEGKIMMTILVLMVTMTVMIFCGILLIFKRQDADTDDDDDDDYVWDRKEFKIPIFKIPMFKIQSFIIPTDMSHQA